MGETERETGKVYDLAAARRARAARQETMSGRAARIRPAVGGGAWYHEAAIREDDQTRRT
jgi:hypothetical protein